MATPDDSPRRTKLSTRWIRGRRGSGGAAGAGPPRQSPARTRRPAGSFPGVGIRVAPAAMFAGAGMRGPAAAVLLMLDPRWLMILGGRLPTDKPQHRLRWSWARFYNAAPWNHAPRAPSP